ncbi:MAG: InlB B-repeat-containing protein [Oscillospiraceae bacterium]|nr:InlB B-repeat-containing protein [Oscillospiraceae bacterium]
MKGARRITAVILTMVMLMSVLPGALAGWSDLLTIIPPYEGADIGLIDYDAGYSNVYAVGHTNIGAWYFPNAVGGGRVRIGGESLQNALVFRAGVCNPVHLCRVCPVCPDCPPKDTHKDVWFSLNGGYTKLQGRLSIPDIVKYVDDGKMGRVGFFTDGAGSSPKWVNVDSRGVPFEIDLTGARELRIRYVPVYDDDTVYSGNGSGNSLAITHLRIDDTIPELETAKYTVTFNGTRGNIEGGKNSLLERTVARGKRTNLPKVTRRGYLLDGWWTAPATGGRRLDGKKTPAINGTPTYYARWISAKPPRPRPLRLTNPSLAKMKIGIAGGRVTGVRYQIQIATNKKFTKNFVSRTSFGTVKLKRNTTYYVRVRARRRDSAGKFANSGWRNSRIRLTKR